MSDATLRILMMTAGICIVGAFKPQIMRFLKRIGYTGWQ